MFGEKAEAAGLLRAHLPETVSRELVWSSLRWQSVSFIDDRLRDSESDLLCADRAQGRRRTGVAVRAAGARPDQGGAGRHPRRVARSHRATGDDGGPAPGGRLEAQIGCGLPALDGRVVLTPYGTLALAAEDTRDYRAGARLDLQAFDLRLAGTRRESTGAAADHELTLRGGLRL